MPTVGRKIQRRRKELGIDQKEFAERLGINQSTVSRIENDMYSVNIAQLKRISAVLKVTGDYFLEPSPEQEAFKRETIVQLRELDKHGAYEDMLDIIKTAETAPVFQETYGVCLLVLWKASAYYHARRYKDAIDTILCIIDTLPQMQDKSMLAFAPLILAKSYIYTEDLDNARSRVEESIHYSNVYGMFGDEELKSNAYHVYSIVQTLTGDIEQSFLSVNRAERLIEPEFFRVVSYKANIVLQKGSILGMLGRIDEAVGVIEQAIQLFEIIHKRDGLAHAYNNLAQTYHVGGDTENCLYALSKAFEYYSEIPKTLQRQLEQSAVDFDVYEKKGWNTYLDKNGVIRGYAD